MRLGFMYIKKPGKHSLLLCTLACKDIEPRFSTESRESKPFKDMGNHYNQIYLKLMRKTSNLLIRQGSKKSSRENPQTITNASFKSRQSKQTKRTQSNMEFDIHKEMIKAESLNEREQEEIQNEARRTVTKKIKMTENRIQNQIVQMLQKQCSRLGSELEREKLDNQKLRLEIEKLRKSIQILNQKLEKAFNDKTHLSKNQIDGKIENRQLSEELQSLRAGLRGKQNQIESLKTQKDAVVSSMKSQILELKLAIQKLNINNKNIKEEKQQIEEELEERTKEAQMIRQSFEMKKKQWQNQKKELQSNTKSNIERKGEKVTKMQVEIQKLQEKLKQEQVMRKKMGEKNKQYEKQISDAVEIKKELEQQIANMKKRINDLSILKSSNNAIMNQKINKIVEENEKLKNEVQELRTGVKNQKQMEKPVLFGAHDFD